MGKKWGLKNQNLPWILKSCLGLSKKQISCIRWLNSSNVPSKPLWLTFISLVGLHPHICFRRFSSFFIPSSSGARRPVFNLNLSYDSGHQETAFGGSSAYSVNTFRLWPDVVIREKHDMSSFCLTFVLPSQPTLSTLSCKIPQLPFYKCWKWIKNLTCGSPYSTCENVDSSSASRLKLCYFKKTPVSIKFTWGIRNVLCRTIFS